MAKKSKLDRGLDALFSDNFSNDGLDETGAQEKAADKNSGGVSKVRLSLIEPDKKQPRTGFDEEALNELADNIRTHGVLQPILVRPLDNGGYKIVAGERRWRASRLAGLEEIPVYIKEMTDLEAAEISLIENIHRRDLTPLEEAEAYQTLMDTYGLTQQEISEAVGRSRSAVANSLRLLNLCGPVRKLLAEEKLTEGHAKTLAGIHSEIAQQSLAEKCVEKGWSVRELERAAAQSDKEAEPQKKKPAPVFGSGNPLYNEFMLSVNKSTSKVKVSLKQDKKGDSHLDVKFDRDVNVEAMLNTLAELFMNC